jgi:hypothetical protein
VFVLNTVPSAAAIPRDSANRTISFRPDAELINFERYIIYRAIFIALSNPIATSFQICKYHLILLEYSGRLAAVLI